MTQHGLGLRVFTSVSRKTFERMKDDLRALGVTVPAGDTCTIEHRGARGSMTYSERDRRLEVRILEKPFFVPERLVWDLLDRAMRRYDVTAADGGEA